MLGVSCRKLHIFECFSFAAKHAPTILQFEFVKMAFIELIPNDFAVNNSHSFNVDDNNEGLRARKK